METNSKKNIYWINAVKALAIFGVFFSHIVSAQVYPIEASKFHAFISPWYVNAFFFISGYLLFRKQLNTPLFDEPAPLYIGQTGGGRKLFLNIIFRIVIPTILFAAIEYIPSCILRGKEIDTSNAIYKTLGGGTYWFTSALAVAESVLLILLLTRVKRYWLYIVACLVIGGIGMYLQDGYKTFEIWAYHRGIVSLIVLALGGIYWKYESFISRVMKWYVVLGLLAAYVFIIYGISNNDPNISILSLQPWGLVSVILSCVLLIELFKHLPENSVMNYIGQNTIGFYFMSGAIPVILGTLARKIVPGTHIWVVIALWVVSMGLAYLFVYVINKWLPWMFDLRLLKK